MVLLVLMEERCIDLGLDDLFERMCRLPSKYVSENNTKEVRMSHRVFEAKICHTFENHVFTRLAIF